MYKIWVYYFVSESYAYVDWVRDLPLLLQVGHPVAVNPVQILFEKPKKEDGK